MVAGAAVRRFSAEVRTRRFGTLTYTRSGNEAEDITLFDRKRRRNIASYASERKLATRARFYNEDDDVDYDVQHYAIESDFRPSASGSKAAPRSAERGSCILGTLTLRLAEPLVVQSITSPGSGGC